MDTCNDAFGVCLDTNSHHRNYLKHVNMLMVTLWSTSFTIMTTWGDSGRVYVLVGYVYLMVLKLVTFNGSHSDRGWAQYPRKGYINFILVSMWTNQNGFACLQRRLNEVKCCFQLHNSHRPMQYYVHSYFSTLAKNGGVWKGEACSSKFWGQYMNRGIWGVIKCKVKLELCLDWRKQSIEWLVHIPSTSKRSGWALQPDIDCFGEEVQWRPTSLGSTHRKCALCI